MTQSLWSQLEQHGLVRGDEPAVESGDNTPWYIRTMLAIAGWFGALFLLGAVFSVIGLLIASAFTAGVVGIVACVLAVLIYRLPKHNDFLAQFAFAISLAGQSLLVFSILSEFEFFEGRSALSGRLYILSIVTICLQGLLFLVVSNYLHRLWSALLVVASLMFLMNYYGLYPLTQGVLLAVGIGLWLQEFKWVRFGNKLTTPAYALVFMSLILLCANTFLLPQATIWSEIFGVVSNISVLSVFLTSIVMGASLVVLVVVLLKRAGVVLLSGTAIAAILLSVLVACIGHYVPGITIGTVLVLIGFAHSNKVLIGLGVVTLVVFIFQFYYQLDLTLLVKSGLLVAGGLLLLVVRFLMGRLWPAGVPMHA